MNIIVRPFPYWPSITNGICRSPRTVATTFACEGGFSAATRKRWSQDLFHLNTRSNNEFRTSLTGANIGWRSGIMSAGVSSSRSSTSIRIGKLNRHHPFSIFVRTRQIKKCEIRVRSTEVNQTSAVGNVNCCKFFTDDFIDLPNVAQRQTTSNWLYRLRSSHSGGNPVFELSARMPVMLLGFRCQTTRKSALFQATGAVDQLTRWRWVERRSHAMPLCCRLRNRIFTQRCRPRRVCQRCQNRPGKTRWSPPGQASMDSIKTVGSSSTLQPPASVEPGAGRL